MSENISSLELCGIDEAGRGPLAGSLVVAGVVLLEQIDGLSDSKKLSEAKREEIYEQIIKSSRYHIVKFSAKEVDELGISECMHQALTSIIDEMGECDYLFDGNSSFGVIGLRTMIKADTKVPQVSAASILAKVTHDREINQIAKDYPQYGFQRHKGYGTKAHIEAIKKYGRCEHHRYSFKIKGID